MKSKNIFIVIAIALICWFIYDAFSLPGVDDLEGDFKEVAMYRNENNTGPIIRLYAATVNDTLWQEMQQYGNYLPHTKYGNTKVFFFLNGGPAPTTLTPGQMHMEGRFLPFCIAVYEKDAMGQVTFERYPFRK